MTTATKSLHGGAASGAGSRLLPDPLRAQLKDKARPDPPEANECAEENSLDERRRHPQVPAVRRDPFRPRFSNGVALVPGDRPDFTPSQGVELIQTHQAEILFLEATRTGFADAVKWAAAAMAMLSGILPSLLPRVVIGVADLSTPGGRVPLDVIGRIRQAGVLVSRDTFEQYARKQPLRRREAIRIDPPQPAQDVDEEEPEVYMPLVQATNEQVNDWLATVSSSTPPGRRG